MQERLIKRASELLSDGTVDRVAGWKAGEMGYDVTPAIFESAKELEEEFVFSDFCGANLSKYLIRQTKRDGKILVFLKICDTYSLNQLITEHRVDRDKVYVIGIGCSGMADPVKLREAGITGITGIKGTGDSFEISTVYGDRTVPKKDALCVKCLSCKGGEHVIFDELIGEEITPPEPLDRFDGVHRLEEMTPEERYEFSARRAFSLHPLQRMPQRMSRLLLRKLRIRQSRIRDIAEGGSRFVRGEYVPHNPRVPRCRTLHGLRRMLARMPRAHPAPPPEQKVHLRHKRILRRISGGEGSLLPRAAHKLQHGRRGAVRRIRQMIAIRRADLRICP